MEKLPGNEEGKKTLGEWLFNNDTPKTRTAIERIMNVGNLTEVMFDSVNEEEADSVKTLVGEYVEISAGIPSPAVRARMKAIEVEVAALVEGAFDREN
jgi:hypothetical protein